ncbi:MAG: phosphotransferase [Caldilineaceae bacterium]
MMTLNLMQSVVATVSEQWESPLADTLLDRWEHDPGHAKFGRASANFVFFFKKAGRDCVLRFNHASERSAEVIQSEIDYVNTLAANGLRVARPLRSIAGKSVESIATDQGVFHTVVFEVLPGKQLELEEMTPDQLVRWGKILGEFHNAAAGYHQAGRPTWQDQLKWITEVLPAEETAAHQDATRLANELSKLVSSEQNFGLIHGDFELDNLIWEGEVPGIIDFDDCAWNWLVADIAFALGDLFGDSAASVDLQNEAFLHFVEGYRLARPIAQAELERIPLFVQMDNLLAFAKICHSLTPVNPAGELPWMPDLRSKLTKKMNFYQGQFSQL